MKIGIVGLGYVGLPLAVAFAEAGDEVVGLDTDGRRVEDLNAGRSHVEDIPDATLVPLRDRLRATANQADLASCEAIVICVPTPLTGSRDPDLTYMLESATALSGVLQPEQLVVLESTTYPGTTREKLVPMLEERSALKAGTDFNVAFSPERVDPGRTDYTLRTTPKIVGGLTPACLERAQAVYSEVCDELVPSPAMPNCLVEDSGQPQETVSVRPALLRHCSSVNDPDRESPRETRTVALWSACGVVTDGRPGTCGMPTELNVVGLALGPVLFAPLVAVTT